MTVSRVALLLLASLFAVSVASPYWYDDYSYYDLYDEYNVYNMHYKLDDIDHDYLDWDLGNDEMDQHGGFSGSGGSTSKGKSSNNEVPTSYDTFGDDYFSEQEHPYFSYYDDIYGDYFFDDPFEMDIDCTLDEDGLPKLEGLPACDLKIEGADQTLTLLKGGIDGIYKVVSCQHGRPMYQRQNSPHNEERTLWYSGTFKDWDINNGSKPNEDDILVYGGQGDSEMRPQFVLANHWHVASDMSKGYSGIEDYIQTELTIKCADGSETQQPAQNVWGNRPLLTDDEMENQYSVVYKRAAKNAARSDDINLGLVSLFVFIGLAIIFGLPFMVARTRKQRRRGPPGGKKEKGFKLSSLVTSSKKAEHNQ